VAPEPQAALVTALRGPARSTDCPGDALAHTSAAALAALGVPPG
jgi:hypothetical protein